MHAQEHITPEGLLARTCCQSIAQGPSLAALLQSCLIAVHICEGDCLQLPLQLGAPFSPCSCTARVTCVSPASVRSLPCLRLAL